MATRGCPICGEAMRLFSRTGERELLICPDCRHLTWAEMPDEETLQSFYAAEYTGSHGQAQIQDALAKYYSEHAQELANSSGTALPTMAIADIGCSYPVFLRQARRQGLALGIGVDWAEEALAYGRTHGIAMFTPGAFETEVPDGSLDVLRYSHTLEHVLDPAALLTRHVRKLRPGGYVYITQPNVPVFRAAETPVKIHDAVWPSHLHFFSPLSLLRLLERSGLEPILFHTVSDEAVGEVRYRPSLDLAHAERRLAALRDRGEAARGALNNYPFYLGLNATLHARRPGIPDAGFAAARRELTSRVDGLRLQEPRLEMIEDRLERLEAALDEIRDLLRSVADGAAGGKPT